jgi:glutaredoxin 3
MSAKPKILIYGSESCNFCTAARMLLKKKGADYEDILVTRDPERLSEMQQRSGSRSVPQIFIGDRRIGGFEELRALDTSGQLDQLLGIPSNAV